MNQIFISHSSRDTAVVKPIVDALLSQGLNPWFDVRQLTPGDDLDREITDTISAADQFVVVLSRAAMGSKWVVKETDFAKTVAARKPGFKIIPVLIGGVTHQESKIFLAADVVSIPFDERPGAKATAIARLMSAIQDVPFVEPPTAAELAAAPVAELTLELTGPAIWHQEGVRRPQANARLVYAAADGSTLASRPFTFLAPIGPIEAGELQWYLESYWRWPLGEFRRRAERVVEQLPQWGRLLFDASVGPAGQAVLAAWRQSGRGVLPRFTVLVEQSPTIAERSHARQSVGESESNSTDPRSGERGYEAAEAATLLLGLPWELLHDGRGYLFQGARGVRVRRRLDAAGEHGINGAFPAPHTVAPSQPPVRVLLVSPRPDDEQAGYIDHRVSALPVVDALAPLGEFAEWTILTPPTFKALTAELKQAYDADQPYHVVHFDGHGAYDRRHGLGGLCFEDPADSGKTGDRRTHLVHADQLAEALRDHNTPLIFLEACQSAAAQAEPTASVAGRLLAGGVSSVAAMSHSVLVETARRFVGVFYHRLLAGDRVGQAMLHGQLELHGDTARGWSAAGELRLEDWFVPVLFQHRDDPQLLAAIPDAAMRDATANAERLKLGDTPAAPPHGFIGRSRQLLAAERLLCRMGTPARPSSRPGDGQECPSYVVFRGEGGEGKTTLAAELARWLVLSRRFRRAAFVSLEHHVDARAVLHSIGRQLLPGFETEAAGNDDKALLVVQRELKRGPTILVFDNMESVLPWDWLPACQDSADESSHHAPRDEPPESNAATPQAHHAERDGYTRQAGSLSHDPEILAGLLKLAHALAGTGSTRLVFTTREPLPEPFAGHHVTIGRLERSEAVELVARVLGEEVGPAQMVAANETTDEHAIRDLVEAVGCHARALALLAGEIKQSGVSRATASITALMEQLEQKYPGQRERSLLASVELSLRRLPSEVRAKLGPLAAFRGGGWDRIIGIALGLDIQKDEEITLARQLVDVGLAEELPYGYLQLDPALPAALARGQSAEQLAAARAAWRQATLALIRFLYQQQNKDPQMAATLTVLDLPNLLAALEESSHHALRDESRVGENVNPALELNLPSNVSSPDGFHHAERDGYISVDEFVQAATQLEGLLQNLGRPRALARVAKLRAAAARRLGDWSHARFVAESAAVDRLLESGRMQDALSAAQQLLERCQTAGETAFPEAPYDTAMVHIHIGRVLRMGGAAQAALETLAEARRRFTTLADAGNASAARMASACLTETGDCLQDIGRLDEAATAYEEAIELAESLDDDRQVAIGKGQLGTVRMLQGRHAEALAAWHDARRTFEQLGEPATVATAWHQIGMVHQEAGQYPAAEQAYQESLKIKVRMGNHQGEASTLLQLGTLYGTQKRTEEAVRFFGQAAAIYAEIGDSATEGRARNNIAVDLIRLHRHAEARQELLRAIECGRPYGHAAQPWKTFGILSDLERAVGDQAAAEAARQQARAAYLAYRRDGGQVAPGPGMQLCAAVLEAIQSHQIPAASAQLAALQSRTDLPAYLAPLLTALQAILSGRRDPALADNPSFNYADAAELLLLLERLSAPA